MTCSPSPDCSDTVNPGDSGAARRRDSGRGREEPPGRPLLEPWVPGSPLLPSSPAAGSAPAPPRPASAPPSTPPPRTPSPARTAPGTERRGTPGARVPSMILGSLSRAGPLPLLRQPPIMQPPLDLKQILPFPLEPAPTLGLFSNYSTIDHGPCAEGCTLPHFGGPLLKTKRPIISCNVCQIRFNSQSQAEAHYKGNRHARRVKGIEAAKTRGREPGVREPGDPAPPGGSPLSGDGGAPRPAPTPPLPPPKPRTLWSLQHISSRRHRDGVAGKPNPY
ncbi:Zinc finger protein 385A [Camelus dromedarius]|uniref:Zinc finger protein 385A n=1 Tax=Camelus dromedarius TaxID=9838 RepID=A0A5N4DEX2_CAMDR|nr:Zinc finger protein 385A [Camelus dromedarius]